MKLIEENADYLCYRSEGCSSEQSRLPITFSSWSNDGVGRPFGSSLMEKHGLEAVYICAKGNHWFHSGSIVQALAELVETEPDPFFYGSSMGGYAALYFAKMFDRPAFSLSPQTLVRPDDIPEETRWLGDRQSVSTVFSEAELLERSGQHPIYCFFDEEHQQDRNHLDFLRGHCSDDASLAIIDVPFSGHTSFKTLAGARIIQRLLVDYTLGKSISLQQLREDCGRAFLKFPKSAVDYLRRAYPVPGNAEYQSILSRCEAEEERDFEFEYFLAEAYAKIGQQDKALHHSRLAMKKHPRDYVILKHVNLLRSFSMPDQGIEALANFYATDSWSPLLHKFAKENGLLEEVELLSSAPLSDQQFDCPICGQCDWHELGTQDFHRVERGRSDYAQSRVEVFFNEWLARPASDDGAIHWRLCDHCGFVCFGPRPTENGIARKYELLSVPTPDRNSNENEVRPYDASEWAALSDNDYHSMRGEALYSLLERTLTPGARILDYGGGEGALLENFVKAGYPVDLCDFGSGGALSGVHYVGSDVDKIASDLRYDLIIASHVLEHVASPTKTCRALLGRLAPGGRLYVEIPCEIFGGTPQPREPVTHVNYFSGGSAEMMLSLAGGQVESCNYAPYLTPMGNRGLAVKVLATMADQNGPKPPTDAAKESWQLLAGELRPLLERWLPGSLS